MSNTISIFLQSPWAEVRREMIEEKGLDELTADKIGEYAQLNGNVELVDQLMKNEHLTKSKSAVAGLEATKLLLNYCNILGLQDKILFDLSLARGLDYYTGVIYEAVLKGNSYNKRALQERFIDVFFSLLFFSRASDKQSCE